MSVEDKDKFLTEVEEKLEDDLTVSNMKKVRYAITDTLCDYTIQDIRTYDVDASKEELFQTFINGFFTNMSIRCMSQVMTKRNGFNQVGI